MPYCNRCGKEHQFGGEKCPQCGADLPRIGGQREEEAIGRPGYANPLARRMLAAFIDLAIAYGLFAYALLLASRRFRMLRGLIPLATVAVILIPNPYLLLKDAFEGKSLGKLIAGLVAYNEQEQRACGFFDSILRNWYLGIPLVGPTLLAFVMAVQILVGKVRRLGDDSAQTRVITDFDYQRVR